jgi:hypothetical protein
MDADEVEAVDDNATNVDEDELHPLKYCVRLVASCEDDDAPVDDVSSMPNRSVLAYCRMLPKVILHHLLSSLETRNSLLHNNTRSS